MARIKSLSVLLDPEGKMFLAEVYKGVIANVQKATISGQIKNTDLSGDPNAGSVEAKRFANATSKKYGTARTAGKGDNIEGKPVTIPIDRDREFIEEIAQKDISLLGVDGLITKRSANHAMRMAAELDSEFFKEAVAQGTQFTPSAGTTAIQDILEEAIVTLETLKNDYIDGIDRSLLSIQCTPQVYSKIRKYLDEETNNANVDTAAETFQTYHGVRIMSTVRIPQGCSFIIQMDSSIAQPVRSTAYKAERIPLSDDIAVEMFFYYGTRAVTPETILFYAPDGVMTITSEAGTSKGKTAISVSPGKLNSANTYKYKTGVSVDLPALQSTVSDYSDWDGSTEIEAKDNEELVIVELNSDSKVVRVGKTTVTAAS